MDFSALLADLRDVAEKYKGQTTEPQVASTAYADMFVQILKKTQKMTDNYEDQISMLRVALNQLCTIYKDLSQGNARDQLTSFIFGMCAKTVLNIQWSQLDDDGQVKKDFMSMVQVVHENLKHWGYEKFQLILNLFESQWTHPVLTQIMASEDEDIEDGEDYIKSEDPEILKLRIEIMMKENCEEFALNLCAWSLKHPSLKGDLKIRVHQILILYRQQEYKRMQEVCSNIVCHDGIHIMSRFAKNTANQDLCIRLAQVFLIQDWITPDRNCCTQELLKLWIHHQYLADKDEERFLDSIWTVAKVCRSTDQIWVLIDGVRRECGDNFIQLYTELCKYALNIDKGNMEQETTRGNMEEVDNRKKLIVRTCCRMAYMLTDYDFRMSRICGLTAFSLIPTTENLNLVNKLYWTIKHTSVTSGHSKIDPATIYEVERLLGLMRPESLNPDYSWKQLIPVCKRYQLNKCRGTPDTSVKTDTSESVKRNFTKPNILSSAMPKVKSEIVATSSEPQQSNQKQKKQLSNSPRSLQRSHAEHLLAQNKNLSHEKVSQLAREKFQKRKEGELAEGPPLIAKELNKTINDLKKSIVLENKYSVDLAKKLSPLARKQDEVNQKAQSNNFEGNQHQTKVSLPSFQTIASKHGQSTSKGTFNILRPPGSANQECAKIAQQIAEMHEKQRKEKEALEKIRLQGKMDGTKFALNSRNIPSSSQISDLLALTLKDKSGSSSQNDDSDAMNLNKTDTEKPHQRIKGETLGENSVKKMDMTSHLPHKSLKTPKLYLATEKEINKIDSSGNLQLGDSKVPITPVFSIVVPKALNRADNQQQLLETVTNMVKNKNIQANFATHAVIANKIGTSNSNAQKTVNKQHGNTVNSGALFKTHSNSIGNTVQSVSTVQPYTTVCTNSMHQPGVQSPLQTQFSSPQPGVPAGGNSMTPLQLNQNSFQAGNIVMEVQNIAAVSHNTVPILPQSNMNQPVINIQQQQYQQYIQSPVQTQQINQQFLLQPQQYGAHQAGYSPTVYQTQPVMSTQNQIHQQQSSMPVVQSDLQGYGSRQNVSMQAYAMTPNATQSYMQVQQTSDVKSMSPQDNYIVTSQNEMAISNNMPPQHNQALMQNQPAQMNMGSVGVQQDTNKTGYQKPASKQFIAPPELSPAVVQQIFASLKQGSNNRIGRQSQSQTQGRSNQNELDQNHLTKEMIKHLTLNKNDENVKKSVLEATQKILELRQQFGQGNEVIPADKTKELSNVCVPELPDLGSKEFEIDSILSLEENVQPANESIVVSAKQQTQVKESNIVTVQTEKEMLKHIEHFLEVDAKSGTTQNAQKHVYQTENNHSNPTASQKQMQSTYLNANRIAKEREKTQSWAKVTCKHCEHFFSDKQQLQQHMERNLCPKFNPQTDQEFSCSICKTICSSLNELKDHIKRSCRSQSKETPKPNLPLRDFEYSIVYKCTNCNWMNANEKVSSNHVEKCAVSSTCSPSKNPAKLNVVYKCRMCSDIFSDKETIFKHVSKLCPHLKAVVSQREAQECINKLKNTNKLLFDTNKSNLNPTVLQGKQGNNGLDSVNQKDEVCFSKYKDLKPSETNTLSLSSNPGTIKDKTLINGECSKSENDKEQVKSDPENPENNTEARINDLVEKYKTHIASMKSGSATDDKLDTNETELMNSNEIKRLKENFYLEHFKEIEMKRKALKEEKRKEKKMTCDTDNIADTTEFRSKEVRIERKSFKQQKAKEKKTAYNTEDLASTTELRSRGIEMERKALKEKKQKEKKIAYDTENIAGTIELSSQDSHSIAETERKPGQESESSNKKRKVENEPRRGYQDDKHIAYNVKRRRQGEIDDRTEKGLRAKKHIKQKKYWIDEMEPIVKSSDKKSDDSDMNKKHVSKCKFCSFKQKYEMLVKHYVVKHMVGFRPAKNNHLVCQFCQFDVIVEDQSDLTDHIISSHKQEIITQVNGITVTSPAPVEMIEPQPIPTRHATRQSRSLSSSSSPRRSEKIKKHLKALAMRKKCAENLQRIARKKLYTSEEEIGGEDETTSYSENTSETEPNSTRKSLSRIRNLRRLSDTSVLNQKNTRSPTQSVKSLSRMRSRSSSQSSISSMSDLLQSRFNKAFMLTRSGKRAIKNETDSSYVTESSNIEDDGEATEEDEQMEVPQQKRKLTRRNSRCSDRTKSTEDQYFTDSSDDGSVPRFTRSSGSQSIGSRRSLRDKSKKGEKTKTDKRVEKGDKKGKGSRQTSVSDDEEYCSSATDICDATEAINSQKILQLKKWFAERPGQMLGNKTEIVPDKELSDSESERENVEMESEDAEMEGNYSLRKRQKKSIYREYESSDIDNSDAERNVPTRRRMSPRQLSRTPRQLSRTSPRQLSRTSPRQLSRTFEGGGHPQRSSVHKHEITSSEVANNTMSVLIGPDDDEFVDLKHASIAVGSNQSSNTSENKENVILENKKLEQEKAYPEYMNVTVMQSDDEFASLQLQESNFDVNPVINTNTGSIRMSAYNSEFQKFTSQRKESTGHGSSESEDAEEEDIEQEEHSDCDIAVSSDIQDVPVLPSKTDFDAAFMKFAQSIDENVINNKLSKEREEDKLPNFLGEYESFFGNNTLPERSKKNKAEGSKKNIQSHKKLNFDDLKRKYGIVNCYVKLFQLSQKTIAEFCKKSKLREVGKKKSGKPVEQPILIIDSDSSSDTDKQCYVKLTRLEVSSKANERTKKSVKELRPKTDFIEKDQTLIQDIVVPECILSEMLQQADLQTNAQIHIETQISKNSKNNETGVKFATFGSQKIEEDPDYVWVENAESVAEPRIEEGEVKEQEVVIVTEPDQKDLIHNADVVEHPISETLDTSGTNVITIVEDCTEGQENETNNELTNIVFIELDETDEVIITHDIDVSQEHDDIRIGSIKIEVESSSTRAEDTIDNICDSKINTEFDGISLENKAHEQIIEERTGLGQTDVHDSSSYKTISALKNRSETESTLAVQSSTDAVQADHLDAHEINNSKCSKSDKSEDSDEVLCKESELISSDDQLNIVKENECTRSDSQREICLREVNSQNCRSMLQDSSNRSNMIVSHEREENTLNDVTATVWTEEDQNRVSQFDNGNKVLFVEDSLEIFQENSDKVTLDEYSDNLRSDHLSEKTSSSVEKSIEHLEESISDKQSYTVSIDDRAENVQEHTNQCSSDNNLDIVPLDLLPKKAMSDDQAHDAFTTESSSEILSEEVSKADKAVLNDQNHIHMTEKGVDEFISQESSDEIMLSQKQKLILTEKHADSASLHLPNAVADSRSHTNLPHGTQHSDTTSDKNFKKTGTNENSDKDVLTRSPDDHTIYECPINSVLDDHPDEHFEKDVACENSDEVIDKVMKHCHSVEEQAKENSDEDTLDFVGCKTFPKESLRISLQTSKKVSSDEYANRYTVECLVADETTKADLVATEKLTMSTNFETVTVSEGEDKNELEYLDVTVNDVHSPMKLESKTFNKEVNTAKSTLELNQLWKLEKMCSGSQKDANSDSEPEYQINQLLEKVHTSSTDETTNSEICSDSKAGLSAVQDDAVKTLQFSIDNVSEKNTNLNKITEEETDYQKDEIIPARNKTMENKPETESFSQMSSLKNEQTGFDGCYGGNPKSVSFAEIHSDAIYHNKPCDVTNNDANNRHESQENNHSTCSISEESIDSVQENSDMATDVQNVNQFELSNEDTFEPDEDIESLYDLKASECSKTEIDTCEENSSCDLEETYSRNTDEKNCHCSVSDIDLETEKRLSNKNENHKLFQELSECKNEACENTLKNGSGSSIKEPSQSKDLEVDTSEHPPTIIGSNLKVEVEACQETIAPPIIGVSAREESAEPELFCANEPDKNAESNINSYSEEYTTSNCAIKTGKATVDMVDLGGPHQKGDTCIAWNAFSQQVKYQESDNIDDYGKNNSKDYNLNETVKCSDEVQEHPSVNIGHDDVSDVIKDNKPATSNDYSTNTVSNPLETKDICLNERIAEPEASSLATCTLSHKSFGNEQSLYVSLNLEHHNKAIECEEENKKRETENITIQSWPVNSINSLEAGVTLSYESKEFPEEIISEENDNLSTFYSEPENCVEAKENGTDVQTCKPWHKVFGKEQSSDDSLNINHNDRDIESEEGSVKCETDVTEIHSQSVENNTLHAQGSLEAGVNLSCKSTEFPDGSEDNEDTKSAKNYNRYTGYIEPENCLEAKEDGSDVQICKPWHKVFGKEQSMDDSLNVNQNDRDHESEEENKKCETVNIEIHSQPVESNTLHDHGSLEAGDELICKSAEFCDSTVVTEDTKSAINDNLSTCNIEPENCLEAKEDGSDVQTRKLWHKLFGKKLSMDNSLNITHNDRDIENEEGNKKCETEKNVIHSSPNENYCQHGQSSLEAEKNLTCKSEKLSDSTEQINFAGNDNLSTYYTEQCSEANEYIRDVQSCKPWHKVFGKEQSMDNSLNVNYNDDKDIESDEENKKCETEETNQKCETENITIHSLLVERNCPHDTSSLEAGVNLSYKCTEFPDSTCTEEIESEEYDNMSTGYIEPENCVKAKVNGTDVQTCKPWHKVFGKEQSLDDSLNVNCNDDKDIESEEETKKCETKNITTHSLSVESITEMETIKQCDLQTVSGRDPEHLQLIAGVCSSEKVDTNSICETSLFVEIASDSTAVNEEVTDSECFTQTGQEDIELVDISTGKSLVEEKKGLSNSEILFNERDVMENKDDECENEVVESQVVIHISKTEEPYAVIEDSSMCNQRTLNVDGLKGSETDSIDICRYNPTSLTYGPDTVSCEMIVDSVSDGALHHDSNQICENSNRVSCSPETSGVGIVLQDKVFDRKSLNKDVTELTQDVILNTCLPNEGIDFEKLEEKDVSHNMPHDNLDKIMEIGKLDVIDSHTVEMPEDDLSKIDKEIEHSEDSKFDKYSTASEISFHSDENQICENINQASCSPETSGVGIVSQDEDVDRNSLNYGVTEFKQEDILNTCLPNEGIDFEKIEEKDVSHEISEDNLDKIKEIGNLDEISSHTIAMPEDDLSKNDKEIEHSDDSQCDRCSTASEISLQSDENLICENTNKANCSLKSSGVGIVSEDEDFDSNSLNQYETELTQDVILNTCLPNEGIDFEKLEEKDVSHVSEDNLDKIKEIGNLDVIDSHTITMPEDDLSKSDEKIEPSEDSQCDKYSTASEISLHSDENQICENINQASCSSETSGVGIVSQDENFDRNSLNYSVTELKQDVILNTCLPNEGIDFEKLKKKDVSHFIPKDNLDKIKEIGNLDVIDSHTEEMPEDDLSMNDKEIEPSEDSQCDRYTTASEISLLSDENQICENINQASCLPETLGVGIVSDDEDIDRNSLNNDITEFEQEDILNTSLPNEGIDFEKLEEKDVSHYIPEDYVDKIKEIGKLDVIDSHTIEMPEEDLSKIDEEIKPSEDENQICENINQASCSPETSGVGIVSEDEDFDRNSLNYGVTEYEQEDILNTCLPNEGIDFEKLEEKDVSHDMPDDNLDKIKEIGNLDVIDSHTVEMPEDDLSKIDEEVEPSGDSQCDRYTTASETSLHSDENQICENTNQASCSLESSGVGIVSQDEVFDRNCLNYDVTEFEQEVILNISLPNEGIDFEKLEEKDVSHDIPVDNLDKIKEIGNLDVIDSHTVEMPEDDLLTIDEKNKPSEDSDCQCDKYSTASEISLLSNLSLSDAEDDDQQEGKQTDKDRPLKFKNSPKTLEVDARNLQTCTTCEKEELNINCPSLSLKESSESCILDEGSTYEPTVYKSMNKSDLEVKEDKESNVLSELPIDTLTDCNADAEEELVGIHSERKIKQESNVIVSNTAELANEIVKSAGDSFVVLEKESDRSERLKQDHQPTNESQLGRGKRKSAKNKVLQNISLTKEKKSYLENPSTIRGIQQKPSSKLEILEDTEPDRYSLSAEICLISNPFVTDTEDDAIHKDNQTDKGGFSKLKNSLRQLDVTTVDTENECTNKTTEKEEFNVNSQSLSKSMKESNESCAIDEGTTCESIDKSNLEVGNDEESQNNLEKHTVEKNTSLIKVKRKSPLKIRGIRQKTLSAIKSKSAVRRKGTIRHSPKKTVRESGKYSNTNEGNECEKKSNESEVNANVKSKPVKTNVKQNSHKHPEVKVLIRKKEINIESNSISTSKKISQKTSTGKNDRIKCSNRYKTVEIKNAKEPAEEIEDEEEQFKKRMETVKRARRKSATKMQPYVSDFNFDPSKEDKQFISLRKHVDSHSFKVTKNDCKMVTRRHKNSSYDEGNDPVVSQESFKPRCNRDFTEEIKTQMRTRSKQMEGFKSMSLPSPITSQRTRTYQQDSNVQIFSPHIFTCDSVKKITRQRVSLRKGSISPVSSPLPPSKLSQEIKELAQPSKVNNVLKRSRQAIHESNKDTYKFTGIKSPQRIKEQQSDFFKVTSPSSAKLTKISKLNADETKQVDTSHDSSESQKSNQSQRKPARTRSKSSVYNDSGIDVDNVDSPDVSKPDNAEKQNKGKVNLKSKELSKATNERLTVSLRKRTRVNTKFDDKMDESEPVSKVLKPDGTSRSPDNPDMNLEMDMCKHEQLITKCDTCSRNRRSRTTSPMPLYDNCRKTVRQIIHGGKVFEISKGSVTEREIQTIPTKQPAIEEGSTSGVVARGRTRGSKQTKCASSPHPDQSGHSEHTDRMFGEKRKDLNDYIHKTLNEIKKQRGENFQKWTMKKESKGKAPKFPYAFKKTR